MNLIKNFTLKNTLRFKFQSIYFSNKCFNHTFFDNEEDYYTNDELNIKSKLFQMTLANTKIYGWTDRALSISANNIGYNHTIGKGIYKRGIIDIIYTAMDGWNKELQEYYTKEFNENNRYSNLDYLISEINFKNGIKKRLELQIPFIANWNQAIKLGMHPKYIKNTIELLFNSVSIITDRHEGAKLIHKLLIIKLLIFTEFYMLTDRSINYIDTWKTLDNMISVNFKIINNAMIISDNIDVYIRLLINSSSLILPYDFSNVANMIIEKEKLKNNKTNF